MAPPSKSDSTKKKPAKTGQSAIERNKQIGTFASIMTNIDENGQYEHTQFIELKTNRRNDKISVAERNFLKNQAVALMRYGGFSPAEVAKMLGLPSSTISTWRSKLPADIMLEVESSELSQVKNRLAQSLNTALSSIERIALHVSDADYIKDHAPGEVVKLFEALSGYTMRLIEAKQRMDAARTQADRDAAQPTGLAAVPKATLPFERKAANDDIVPIVEDQDVVPAVM